MGEYGERIDDWDELWLENAKLMARKSKDPSTQTGCVIVDHRNRVLAVGFNGFPRGVSDDPARYADRPTKYRLVAHCDANAIYAAASIGVSLDKGIMYLTGPPCSECVKGIIQAGIQMVIWPRRNKFEDDPATLERWKESLEAGALMAREAGVQFVRWEA